jgi:hypothetical protein
MPNGENTRYADIFIIQFRIDTGQQLRMRFKLVPGLLKGSVAGVANGDDLVKPLFFGKGNDTAAQIQRLIFSQTDRGRGAAAIPVCDIDQFYPQNLIDRLNRFSVSGSGIIGTSGKKSISHG